MDYNPTLDDATGSKNIVQKETLVIWGRMGQIATEVKIAFPMSHNTLTSDEEYIL